MSTPPDEHEPISDPAAPGSGALDPFAGSAPASASASPAEELSPPPFPAPPRHSPPAQPPSPPPPHASASGWTGADQRRWASPPRSAPSSSDANESSDTKELRTDPPTPPGGPIPTHTRPEPQPAPPTAPHRTPGWVYPVVVLAAVALFLGGALAGWGIAEQVASDTTDSPAGDQGATVAVGDGGESGLVPDDVLEPVAEVAQAVAPSVVQIDTNFGLGSGVIMDDDGHILTAAHVIEDAQWVRVRLADGTMVEAEVIGTHPETDVGVVAVEAADDLVPAVLGVEADVEVGQMAVAVGSPFGLEQTVTSGIISALDRPVQTEGTGLVGMIQTDASINPGNSGGALADRHGRVIGINDAIRTQGGGNEGVGFAIPIDLAVSIAERLIAGEPIQAGFLGVTANSPVEGRPGALVQEVTPGTPADVAGIEIGDLIIAVDGQPVRGIRELRARILALDPGTPVIVTVERGDEELDIEVVLTVSEP